MIAPPSDLPFCWYGAFLNNSVNLCLCYPHRPPDMDDADPALASPSPESLLGQREGCSGLLDCQKLIVGHYALLSGSDLPPRLEGAKVFSCLLVSKMWYYFPVIVQQNNEEAIGAGGGNEPWDFDLSEFAALHPLTDYRVYLTDPMAAFIAAWHYDLEPNSDFLVYLGDIFPELLREMCGSRDIIHQSPVRPQTVLFGNSQDALSIYLGTIARLLRTWRNEPPPSGLWGDATAHWCDQHPEILQAIQVAMCSRSFYFSPERIEWTQEELRPGGPAHSKDNVKLGLVSMVRFIGQRTWHQAARTAAYALFGTFLGNKPEIVGFCRRCNGPFYLGKPMVFCSKKCAHNYHSSRGRDAEARISRRMVFRKMAKALAKWLQGIRRTRPGWSIQVQNAAGMQTRDGRKNRTLGAYIRASRTEVGSPEREKLLDSLQDLGSVSWSQNGSKERKSLQHELDAFLRNIQQAEEIQQRSKPK